MSTIDIGAPGTSSQQAVAEASSSRVVPKPVPESQAHDARAYQLQQLRKRYSPRESTLNGGVTSLRFSMKPSDPDFPFELDYLDVELKIPSSYPKQPPVLSVKNQDIPRGFGVNIERGWDNLVAERRGATLLSLTNALDRNLESFLTEQKAETVKMTIFKDTRHLDVIAPEVTNQPKAEVQPPPQRRPLYRPETFTREQMAEAKARRAQETRQLESRMGRLPLYQKSSDGIVYSLPLDPKRRTELPVGLRPVKSVQLIIPLLYPLQQIRVLLNDVESGEAELVEELFAEKAAAQRSMSLMSHVNYLTQNVHVLAKQAQANRDAALAAERARVKEESRAADDVDGYGKAAAHLSSLDDVKGHIKVIPRPPEWSQGQAGESESDSDDSYDSDEDGQGGASLGPLDIAEPTSNSTRLAEKGTAITFPSIELYGVEILEINNLSVSVKCLRCKTSNDVGGLKPNVDKTSSCKKCGTEFIATFRPELVHQNSTRAGFINLSGCTITDLLPSTFVPTCSKCSTAAAQGFVSVRGDATTNICRECHGRFTFKIPDVRLQSYSSRASASLPPTSGPRRRQDKQGLHAGEPLPARGACEHYKKSYRWFRFSCCDRVSPCDKCHDAEADGHVHEWANRMICGWCSREQNYRVDSCGFCGRSVVGRRGTGYWEGGKGTRDHVLMRRNDRRKHKRIGGGDNKKKE